MLSRRDFIRAGVACYGGMLLRPLQANTVTSPYVLTASPGEVRFEAGQTQATRVMQYNQSIPGPLIRLVQGRESTIRFRNRLDEPSSVHWHGLRIENAMDGVPGMTQEPVEAGAEFDYRLTPPDAGTYWYHSHFRSWAQQALGLAGVLIVDEEAPPLVDRDLVLALDDWRLDEDLQFDAASLGSLHDWSHGGRLGNYLSVNGLSEQRFPVESGETVRLRLLNIANARIMRVLVGEPAVSVVAIDGQPVEPHGLEEGRITLPPGARADLMIDMTGKPGDSSALEVVVGEYAYEVSGFDYGSQAKRENLLDAPVALPQNPLNRISLPREFQHVALRMEGGAMSRMRSAIFEGRELDLRELVENRKLWAINGVTGLPEEPLFRVKRGSAVSLDVENDNNWPHAMHIHGHHCVHDKSPGVWRDTILFSRGERGSMQFVADNPGKWLIHCHMTEHMAAGMVTWFEVVT